MPKLFFGKGKQELRGTLWDWENFTTTEGFPVSENLLDWIIGQDQALTECYLCLDEWINKLTRLGKLNWWSDWEDPNKDKTGAKDKLVPGPYLLLLGEPGTGKSLLGKALATRLTSLYKQQGIALFDVLSWPNIKIPSEPKITIHPSPIPTKL